MPRTPPPDLPSMLLDGRIVYIGMSVSDSFDCVDLNWCCGADWKFFVFYSAGAGGYWDGCGRANVSSVAGSQGACIHLHQLHWDYSWRWRDC